jgi:formylglycine-generating enzyme required for sulfatase activity
MDRVLDEADALEAKHILYILDACFSGLALHTRTGEFDPNRTLAQLLTRQAAIAITAGGREVVDDSAGPSGEHSIFTHFLLKGLMGEAAAGDILRARSLGMYLEDRVAGYRRSGHKPNFGYLPGSEDGDFVFVVPNTQGLIEQQLQRIQELGRRSTDEEALTELRSIIATSNDPEVRDAAAEVLVTQIGRGQKRATVQQPDPQLYHHVLKPKWIEIPAGPFLMGSDPARDPHANEDEMPQIEVTLNDYYIAKYPVTVVQFTLFRDDDGYTNPDYWTNTGWQWRQKYDITRPGYWQNSMLYIENHPVVGVSWYEAYAYCQWLSRQLEYEVRLPTEAEWEKAARGTDGRVYPWGDTFDSSRCNSRESDIGNPTMVGAYSPQGDSPYGCADMAGGVWEWCLTKWRDNDRIGLDNDSNESEDQSGRVLRGGRSLAPRDSLALRTVIGTSHQTRAGGLDSVQLLHFPFLNHL